MDKLPKMRNLRERAGLIFYVGRKSKTRHLHFSLGSLLCLFGFLGLTLLWLPISMGVIMQLNNDKKDLKESMYLLKKNVFELEDTYEHVFDKTYGSPATNNPSSTSSSSPSPSVQQPTAQKSPSANTTGPVPAANKNNDEDLLLSSDEPPEAKASEKTPVEKAPAQNPVIPQASVPDTVANLKDVLEIKNFHVEQGTSKNLEVSFELHNLKKTGTQQGYIWAIAFYKIPGNDKDTFVSLPSSLKMDQSLEQPINPKKGHRFNFRNFSKTTLYSEPLVLIQGAKLYKVKLGIHGLNHKLLLTRVFDLSSQKP
jgi:hypothetical protein